jgi:hypothetical protein
MIPALKDQVGRVSAGYVWNTPGFIDEFKSPGGPTQGQDEALNCAPQTLPATKPWAILR